MSLSCQLNPCGDTPIVMRNYYILPCVGHYAKSLMGYLNSRETGVVNWMFVCPQNAYAEILTPNVLVGGGRASGMFLGQEGGDLGRGISVLVKEIAEWSLTASTR